MRKTWLCLDQSGQDYNRMFITRADRQETALKSIIEHHSAQSMFSNRIWLKTLYKKNTKLGVAVTTIFRDFKNEQWLKKINPNSNIFDWRRYHVSQSCKISIACIFFWHKLIPEVCSVINCLAQWRNWRNASLIGMADEVTWLASCGPFPAMSQLIEKLSSAYVNPTDLAAFDAKILQLSRWITRNYPQVGWRERLARRG